MPFACSLVVLCGVVGLMRQNPAIISLSSVREKRHTKVGFISDNGPLRSRGYRCIASLIEHLG
ncbi:hypothetical protein OKW35_005587 [Paraburkholderia sp. MM5477-R1]